METKVNKLTQWHIDLLKKRLPEDAVTQHPTKTFLSSIKAIYVIERLNEVFGIGSWHFKSEIVDNKTSMIVVKSTLTIPEFSIELESYGGNNNGGENSKNFDLGDAYKGACTDAMTKICSYLEIGMDVFKGKQQGKGKSTPYITPTAPAATAKPVEKSSVKLAITEKQMERIIERINKGEPGVYENSLKAFTFTEDQRADLETAQANQPVTTK